MNKKFDSKKLLTNAHMIDYVADRMQTPGEAIQEIPLKKIRIKENVRKDYKGIEELAESIREKGLLQPITVTACEDGFYEVVFGHRRYKGVCLLNEKDGDSFLKIQAIVKKKDEFDEQEIKQIQIIENIQREDLSFGELKEGLVSLRESGLSNKDIAQQLGKGEGYIKHIFSSIKAINENAELSELINSDAGVTMTDIQTVKHLPYKDQVFLIKEKLMGNIKSREELRQAVKETNENIYKENAKVYEQKKSFDVFTHLENRIKVKAFIYDKEKASREDKEKLLTNLENLISTIRIDLQEATK